jgi:histidinol-phosphate aminotransferase
MRRMTTDDILSLKPYAPGKPIDELERELGITGSIKLASNENPIGPSPKAVEAVEKLLGGLHRYPDGAGFNLKKAISDGSAILEGIIASNGSNELINYRQDVPQK